MSPTNRRDVGHNEEMIDRDELVTDYLELLPFAPYPVQEEALLAWFTCRDGVLVCTPTGTGKTLIAEAAIYEALRTGRRAYYTTPLIALTEQKLAELQRSVQQWGFAADSVGLVTGNRRVNPDAPVLVVVAEILFNRLLREPESFADVSSVVMDEFHSFNDPERGIVWEFTLGLLPPSIRLLLLSATVGNAYEFVQWMRRTHGRNIELVQSDERKIPLSYHWVEDALLTEQIESMVQSDAENRRTPALVFCFNREQCWSVAEQLKGKKLLTPDQRRALLEAIDTYDWSGGAGAKLRQLVQRGVGVHHAGLLPKYKRIVERLFQDKLLSVAVCTETLAAGINLPARSVVIPNLMKGPRDDKKLIEPSSAHQMFGRAGRPQYDVQGYVYALAHEDDVKILRWRRKYDQIPEDTKDPQLRKAKKALKRKMPTRRTNERYWTSGQFHKLHEATPAKMRSRGHIPWRLLAYMLDASPEVQPIRELIAKRLMSEKQLVDAQRELDQMLRTLWTAGYVTLEPSPIDLATDEGTNVDALPIQRAVATDRLPLLLHLRGINPIYGLFAVNHLDIADGHERLQIFESMLEMPGSVARHVRVPPPDQLPPGTLAITRLDPKLLQFGLATLEELTGQDDDGEQGEESQRGRLAFYEEPPARMLTVAEKLYRLFEHDFPGLSGIRITPVWAAGELLEFGGNFEKYIASKGLQKQEGIIFRHLLRLILLLGEFANLSPVDYEPEQWRDELNETRRRLTDTCRDVDSSSVDHVLEAIDPDTIVSS